MDLTERQLSRETIYEGKILHIYRDDVLLPNDRTSVRDAAGVVGDLAHARSAVWQEHVVAVDMQNFSLVDRLAGKLAFGQIHDKTAS